VQVHLAEADEQAKYADAILPLTELLEIDPNDLNVLGNRGFAYVQSGKPREAITDWTIAAKRGGAYAPLFSIRRLRAGLHLPMLPRKTSTTRD
jgi:hypothetical protein